MSSKVQFSRFQIYVYFLMVRVFRIDYRIVAGLDPTCTHWFGLAIPKPMDFCSVVMFFTMQLTSHLQRVAFIGFIGENIQAS